MEEELELGKEILLRSLEKSGVPLPHGVSSIQTLTQTPGAFFSICARSLRQIDQALLLTEEDDDLANISMAKKFNTCTEMSAAIDKLGYTGAQISFHQFLYPSQEDLYNLLRFLVERLSDTSLNGGDISFVKETVPGVARGEECKLKHPLSDWTENTEISPTSRLQNLTMKETEQLPPSQTGFAVEEHKLDELAAVSVPIFNISRSLESTKEDEPHDTKSEAENFIRNASGNKDSHDAALDDRMASHRAQSSEMRNEIEDLRSQGDILQQELTTKALESQHLKSKYELLKATVEMAFNGQHPEDFNVKELNKQVEAEKQNLQELESHWNASTKPLEKKKRSLEELLHAGKPDMQLNLQRVKEVELETEAIILEIQRREKEHFKLSAELEKWPKAASRKLYIQRISEITKNSRKQDADIERILKDTRDLQIESNSIQERLHRTYVVADETMFRDVKKDPVRQQAYRLLATIHEKFGQISEKILITDRIRREVVDQEAKLGAVSRNLNIDKLQADLDAMRKENELLEKQLHHHSITTPQVALPDDSVDEVNF